MKPVAAISKSIAIALVASLALVSGTLAQSPTSSLPADAGSPDPSIAPIDDAFPYRLVAPPQEVPLPAALRPMGRPDASIRKHGIRVELWLSSPVARPGEWVQAVVRTTNLLRTTAWFLPYPCMRSGTVVGVDARSGTPPGEEHSGSAAEFKRRAVRKGPYLWAGFDHRRDVLRWVTSSASAGAHWAFVECPMRPEPRRLAPRASITEHFAWYPASSFDDDVWFQPLWPGTASVTASWPFLGRGTRPAAGNGNPWRKIKRIEASAEIEIAGDGPGTPSIAELVDAALADPRFRAWVDEDPTRQSWTGVSWGSAPGPTYPHNLYAIGMEDPPPTGLLWLELDRVQVEPERNHQLRGVVTLDPWTGEVLRVHCIGPASPQCSAPTVLDEAPESDPPSEDGDLATALVQAVTSLPGVLWPDAPVPESLADFVPAAREQLWAQAIDGLRLPLHLRFLEARCSPDGGVALVFEEIGPPYGRRTYAYAVRASMPTSPDDGWGAGGTGQASVLDDPEFIHLMGSDHVACP